MYPVSYQADFAEPRSRLTNFFRYLLAIPHLVWAALYGIAASLAVLVAWFAIVFTAHYPAGLYDFVAGFLRYYVRVQAYIYYLTDAYPPFDGGEHPEYPVRMQIGAPRASYSRLKTFFRAILAIPIMVLRYVLSLLLSFGGFAAWVVIVVTGRQLRGLQEILVLGSSYTSRSDAYLLLLTETYPPFSDDMKTAIETPTGGGPVGSGPQEAPAGAVLPSA